MTQLQLELAQAYINLMVIRAQMFHRFPERKRELNDALFGEGRDEAESTPTDERATAMLAELKKFEERYP